METQNRQHRPGTLRKLAPFGISFVAGAFALILVLGVYAWENKSTGKTALVFFARTMGYDAFLVLGESKGAALKAAPGNYFRDIKVPKVVLDVKFEHWEKSWPSAPRHSRPEA